jgi:hypothetical protein
MDSLEELAYKWHMKAPWASNALINEDIKELRNQIFLDAGADYAIELMKERFDHPFEDIKLPSPLKISIGWTSYLEKGREETLTRINKLLASYEFDLKQEGAREFPNELKTYAHYWFEHYVRKMKYPDIAKKYVVNPETIKRKVWEFRRLLSVNL